MYWCAVWLYCRLLLVSILKCCDCMSIHVIYDMMWKQLFQKEFIMDFSNGWMCFLKFQNHTLLLQTWEEPGYYSNDLVTQNSVINWNEVKTLLCTNNNKKGCKNDFVYQCLLSHIRSKCVFTLGSMMYLPLESSAQLSYCIINGPDLTCNT